MGIRDYLHENAEESRHNETISCLMIVIGATFLVGGVLETVLKVENPGRRLFIPFQLSTDLYSMGLSIDYAMDRSRYMTELHKMQMIEEKRVKNKSRIDRLELPAD